MTSGFANKFTGNPVKPAQVQYEPLTFTVSTSLVWPTESLEGANYVAAWMNCVASAASLSLIMPDATIGTPGVAAIMTNIGAYTFSVTDSVGTLIGTIEAGQSWVIVLEDNSTASGAWQAVQLGATTSNAQAAALAGAGLQAIIDKLQIQILTVSAATNQAITADYRAKGFVWTGVNGTIQLDALSTLTVGWWFLATNNGTGTLTISATGTDTINGHASITLPANPDGTPYSTIIVAGATGFVTFGGAPSVIPISGGGTGATSSDAALVNFGGTTLGISLFKVLTPAAALELLGIGPSAFTEATTASNQSLTSDSANTAFICTTALTISLPDSTDSDNGIDDRFLFAVYAYGGDVTLAPVSTDAVNGNENGVSFVITQGSSAIVFTDGDKHWWVPFCYNQGIQWSASAGAGDAYTSTFTPLIPFFNDGLVIGIRMHTANTVVDPTLKVDNYPARTITKLGGKELAPNDIPGNNFDAIFRLNEGADRWELMNPVTTWLDNYSTSRGATVFRGKDYWEALAPGLNKQILTMYVDDTDSTIKYVLWKDPPGPKLHTRTFTSGSSITFDDTVDTNTVFEVTGAGGGGGASGGPGGGNGNGGAGGGAGAYGRFSFSGMDAGEVASITIGTGGNGGSGSTDGTDGTASTFVYGSASFNFGGGGGGVAGGPSTGGSAGTCTVSAGSLTLLDSDEPTVGRGGDGQYLGNSIAVGGAGGSNPLGQGGATSWGGNQASALTGNNGTGHGGGGGGGAENGGTLTNGGNGTNGVIILRWVS